MKNTTMTSGLAAIGIAVLAACGAAGSASVSAELPSSQPSSAQGATHATTTPESTPTTPASESQMLFVDGPQYGSLSALQDASTVVAVVSFDELLASQTEGEINGGASAGLPMQLWRVTVTEAIKGSVGQSVIAIADGRQVSDVAAVEPGDSALLLLRESPTRYQGVPLLTPVGVGLGLVPILDGRPAPIAGPQTLLDEIRAWSPPTS